MKRLTILGSTGSIGTQTLEVCEAYPESFQVIALAAGRNIKLIEEQTRKFKPQVIAVWDEKDANSLREKLRDLGTRVLSGMEGLIAVSTLDAVDVVVTAIVGMIGIQPTVAAIKAHKDIALANKETLVCAGHLIMPMAKEYGVNILPVDSEHSAIFQSLNGENRRQIHKLLLTASGGPFRGRKREELVNIRPEDALKHPNWSMGAKITIDSSTLVNKGLEVMEAKWLFGVEYSQVQVVVQPQSIIHSMVEFEDGGIIAQLGTPDMKLPIQYALTYPDRWEIKGGERLDFTKLSGITFEVPDTENFPALKLAYQVGEKGGNMPTIFNAANEMAVAEFLNRKIGYLDIYQRILDACGSIEFIDNPSVEEILETQRRVEALFN